MLVMKFSRSGRIAATPLPAKGQTDFGVKVFRNFIQSTGVRKFINMSDNENALVSLKEAAARACEGVESVSRSVPVGDLQANGHAESAVKQVKGVMRTLRFALESRLGQKLLNTHCKAKLHTILCQTHHCVGPRMMPNVSGLDHPLLPISLGPSCRFHCFTHEETFTSIKGLSHMRFISIS